ncbi:MAG: CPBP family intramembrane metalloprotease [Clostridia bacterium]|nr:CPBP family intramembrane metalloprotease [Clostridia bacterium]
MTEKIKTQFKSLFEGADRKAVFAVLWMTLVITLYFYFGIQDFFEKSFGRFFSSPAELVYYKYVYHNFAAFFFFFVLTAPFSVFVLKNSAEETGLKLPKKKLSLKIMLAALIIAPLAGLSAAVDTEMAAMYPLGGEMIFYSAGFFLLYYVSYIAYYFGWEYLFRGFGFFNISRKYGGALAIAVTTMVSALIHSSIAGFGKPFTETFSAIFGGILFGFIAYKTKSIYPAFMIHLTLGFSMDMLIRLLA